jgi:hypothetical protein
MSFHCRRLLADNLKEISYSVMQCTSMTSSGAETFCCRLRESLATSTRWALCLGGLLSLGQQILDAYATHNPQIVSGNLTKAALAILTLGFSLISLSSHMFFKSLAVMLGIGGERWWREAPDSRNAEVGSTQAEEARGDELTEALLSADEGSRPMAKTVRVKNSLRTLL